jgi:hypothetical protein
MSDNEGPTGPTSDSKRRRLEELAERRRRRLQAEAADLAGAFPGDDFYQGEQLNEVPDAQIEGNDDYDDEFDEGQEDHDGDHDDEDYDEDASYAPDLDDAAAVLLGGRGRKKGRRRRGQEEEEEGEDLMDDAMKDYQPIAALDTYGREGIDDRDYDGMDVDERREVERVLAQRDRERRR